MLVPVCHTCHRLLADKQIPYEKGMEKICNDKSLTEKQKADQKKKLLDDIGLDRYCCRMRMISFLDQAKLII